MKPALQVDVSSLFREVAELRQAVGILAGQVMEQRELIGRLLMAPAAHVEPPAPEPDRETVKAGYGDDLEDDED